MEALKEIIEIFKEFDGNNVWIVIGISAFSFSFPPFDIVMS